MTKRHFSALAAAIATLPEDQRKSCADVIAAVCQQFNDRFDYKRFVRLCGVSLDKPCTVMYH